MATEDAALSATETIRAAQDEAGSLATLVPRYLHALHLDAEQRYARATAEALGDQAGADLSADPACGAVVRRLFDTEASGRTETSTPQAPPVPGLLPWVPAPRQAPSGSDSSEPASHLNKTASLITTRVDHLADTAVRHRPPWTLPLGQPPANPEAERQWRRHIAVIATYRDQHKVASDDPRQVLGPYPARGHAGHTAYWHAAEAVLAARQLAALDPANVGTAARAQAAVDIYRALPAAERAAISAEMAARLGPLWFGDPAAPDEDATQPAHAAALADTLTRHGHLTSVTVSSRQHISDEPLEAARRNRTRRPTPSSPVPRSGARPLLEPPDRYAALMAPTPQPRLG